MADKKISQLTQAITPLSGGELVPIVQNGETVKVNVGDLRADTSEFVEKTGDTMTGALSIDATGTALTVPNGISDFNRIQLDSNKFLRLGTSNSGNGFNPTILFNTGSNSYLDLASSDSSFSIRDKEDFNSIRFTFTRTSGRLGINTTNPQAKLDVNGDLRTDSLLEKSKNGSVSGGSYFLIWDSYGNHDIILTQNTEILQGDIPPVGYSQVITINVIGDFALTLPVEWEVKNGGVYDGVNGSQIVVQSWDNGNFYTVIN